LPFAFLFSLFGLQSFYNPETHCFSKFSVYLVLQRPVKKSRFNYFELSKPFCWLTFIFVTFFPFLLSHFLRLLGSFLPYFSVTLVAFFSNERWRRIFEFWMGGVDGCGTEEVLVGGQRHPGIISCYTASVFIKKLIISRSAGRNGLCRRAPRRGAWTFISVFSWFTTNISHLVGTNISYFTF